MNVLALFSNVWQKELVDSILDKKYNINYIQITGFYKKEVNYNVEDEIFVINRENTFFKPFSLLDGIMNKSCMKSQFLAIINKLQKIDLLIIDNPERYVELIIINNLNVNAKIICLQHGIDPSEKILNSFKKNKFLFFLKRKIRAFIFSKKISNYNVIYNSQRIKFIFYSEYFKNSYMSIFKNINSLVYKNPRLSIFKSNKIVNFNKDSLLLFTGMFRYKEYSKYLNYLFVFLEKSSFSHITIKPKKGEETLILDYINKNNLNKNYFLLSCDQSVSKIIKNFSNFICSIESNLTLELSELKYEKFFIYDFVFYQNSLIRKVNLKRCSKTKFSKIYNFFPMNNFEKNYFFGYDQENLKINEKFF